MNTVLKFIESNRQRLRLEEHGVPTRLSCVIRTGQSRTSGHVVVLLLDKEDSRLRLVAKLARLPGVNVGIEGEAANLRAVQAARPGGFDSLPRVVALEKYDGRSILLVQALVGAPLEPALRRDFEGACRTVNEWLTDLHAATRFSDTSDAGWYEQLVERPLRHFADVFPLAASEVDLLRETRRLTETLRGSELPLVFEHGDLSCPNILLAEAGGAGVVDWELAQPRGLPACDVFFFLANAAFARRQAYRTGDYLSPFREAFFGRGAWARSHVRNYAEALRLSPEVLTPLFVSCWARYTDNLLLRLSEGRGAHERPGPEMAAWLRSYRYYTLWHHTLAHIDELDWEG